MKNFTRLFKVTDGNADGWTDSTRTTFVLKIESNILEMYVKGGRNPFVQEVNTAFGLLLKEYETEFGEKVETYHRRCRYRFCFTEGMSGCQDTYIEYDKNGDGFPTRSHMLHESCFSKASNVKCFVYDFLDLCVAIGFISSEDGCYIYDPENDANSDMHVSIIKPRLLDLEDGWTSPYDHASQIVYLKTVRERPEEPEDSEESGSADEGGEEDEG